MYTVVGSPIPNQRLNFQILPNLDLAKYCVYAISGKRVINCLSEIHVLSVMYGCCLNRVTNPASMQSGSIYKVIEIHLIGK